MTTYNTADLKKDLAHVQSVKKVYNEESLGPLLEQYAIAWMAEHGTSLKYLTDMSHTPSRHMVRFDHRTLDIVVGVGDIHEPPLTGDPVWYPTSVSFESFQPLTGDRARQEFSAFVKRHPFEVALSHAARSVHQHRSVLEPAAAALYFPPAQEEPAPTHA